MQRIEFFPPGQEMRSSSFPKTRSQNLRILFFAISVIAAFHLVVQAAASKNTEYASSKPAASGVSSDEEIEEIKPGRLVRGSLNRNDKHTYKIKLEAGYTTIVRILENNAQMTLTSFEVGGEIQSASEISSGGVYYEDLIIVAEEPGFYRIEVTNYRPTTYAIEAQTPHETSEPDRKYLTALKLSRDILKTFWDPTKSQKQKFLHAVETTEEKLSIYRDLGNPRLIAIALADLGFYISNLDETSKTFEFLKQSLEVLNSMDAPYEKSRRALMEASILSKLGETSRRLGNFQGALDFYQRSLILARSISDANGKNQHAETLHDMGVTFHLLGDEKMAEEFYKKSLEVSRSIIPQTDLSLLSQALTLCNLGNLHRGIGADELPIEFIKPRTVDDRLVAIEYYTQALELSKTIPNRGLRNFSLLKIGNSYKELRDFREATRYLGQAEAVMGDFPSKDLFNLYRSLGNLHLLQSEFQKGVPYFERALDLLAKLDNNPELIDLVAGDYYAGGETQKALELYEQSLSLSREREQAVNSAASLYEIARIERDQGNFANARDRIEEAIEISESLRARITSLSLRATYFSTVNKYYLFYIDLLMQAHRSQPEKGLDRLALEMSERSKSRSLLDLLAQAGVDVRKGIDPELLRRYQEARERLVERAYQQNRLLLRKHTADEASLIESDVVKLTEELRLIETEVKNKSPRYAALTQPTSLKLKQIQRIIDAGTVLLEYSLGEKQSYLWAVTPGTVIGFDLPGRAEIETQAQKVYELLTVRNARVENESVSRRSIRIRKAEAEYAREVQTLSGMILDPALPQIANKRVLIVADGAMNYIPFAALPLPKGSGPNSGAGRLFGTEHEIVTLPSASVLALLREETISRKPAPKLLAVFADPVFDRTDVRFGQTKPKTNGDGRKETRSTEEDDFQDPTREFERSVDDLDLAPNSSNGLPRLPFSRREADSIYRLAPKNLGLREVDFGASKRSVFDSGLEQYRILHFATHSLINGLHPEISGIVLSMIDIDGQEIDGFVRLQDIYNLTLSADLVVLSACNTALGKDVKGEGLIGLTRGFMYAGTPTVIASLWKVDDAATAELMTIFYKKMLTGNLRPAAALRAAQTEMMKQPRWKSPYYWAPFTIQGEWR